MRAPGSSRWMPVYLGATGPNPTQTVAAAHLEQYLQDDGCFGPLEERELCLSVLDLQRRGFDLQVR